MFQFPIIKTWDSKILWFFVFRYYYRIKYQEQVFSSNKSQRLPHKRNANSQPNIFLYFTEYREALTVTHVYFLRISQREMAAVSRELCKRAVAISLFFFKKVSSAKHWHLISPKLKLNENLNLNNVFETKHHEDKITWAEGNCTAPFRMVIKFVFPLKFEIRTNVCAEVLLERWNT